MAQRIDELLQECTVKILVLGKEGWGTGFFVAPSLVLTCAHVVETLSSTDKTQIYWKHKKIDGVQVIQRATEADLALLNCPELSNIEVPCVHLDDSFQPTDTLYTYGYSDSFPEGTSVTGECEGSAKENGSKILVFKLAQIRPGLSGSPLLNFRTNKVCGIVKFTRDRAIDLGGGAIPTSVIFENFPQLMNLQEEYHQRHQQWSNFQTPLRNPENLPRSGVLDFVGRENDLAKLHRALQGSIATAVTSVIGMGGIGKTELALQYAMKYQSSYPAGICWISAEENHIETQIIEFSRSILNLNLPKDLKSVEKVKFCWQNWLQGDALIVFDDVADYSIISPYLPPATDSRFKILITSRLQMGTSIHQLELDVLKPLSALSLLSSLVGDKRIHAEVDQAEQLCKRLGCLPLGLELTGRYLSRRPHVTLTGMLDQLENKRLEARALYKADSDMTAQIGVAAAFETSWETLSKEAQSLGCLLSVFADTQIPWSIVEACLADKDLEELGEIREEELVGLHLLQRISSKSYRLHPLIRDFFQSKLMQQENVDNLNQAVNLRLIKVVSKNPTNIAQILKDKLLNWQVHKNDAFLSEIDYGQRLRGLTQEWVQWIYPLSKIIIPLREDGSLPTLGVRKESYFSEKSWGPVTYLLMGWYFPNDQTDIIKLPSEASKLLKPEETSSSSLGDDSLFDVQILRTSTSQSTTKSSSRTDDLFELGWNQFSSAPLSSNLSWAWEKTFNQVASSLTKILERRAIPIGQDSTALRVGWDSSPPIPQLFPPRQIVCSSNSALRESADTVSPLITEGAWYAAMLLTKKYSPSQLILDPIPISDIEDIISQSTYDNQFLGRYVDSVRLNHLRHEIFRLKSVNEQYLFYPWPNRLSNSSEKLLAHAIEIYQAAIQEYQKVIGKWFPKLSIWLETNARFPALAKGVFVPFRTQSCGAGLSWYWEVLPRDCNSGVDLRLSEHPISSDDSCFKEAYHKYQILRPNSFSRFDTLSLISGDSEMFNIFPVTNLVYKWLWQDFSKIGWTRDRLNDFGLFGH
jgi:hypothetical protein